MSRGVLAILCFVAGLLVLPVAAYIYIAYGRPPVATADAPFPFEARIVAIPLDARIHREMPGSAPLAITDANLSAGATVYKQECAFCHGLPGHISPRGATMFPRAPQLWQKHRHGSAVGVSDDPVGETYWKVKNGIRLTGMPAYQQILSEDQMWQVSLLLSQADKPMSPAASSALQP